MSPITASNTDLGGRQAKTSDEYVQEILAAQQRLASATGRTKVSASEKKARLSAILSSPNYMQRLGASMVGPIQLKLRYQGLTRSVLVEDALTPGVPVEYDVLDQLGQAYILHGSEAEVKVTPFEGKRAPVRLFRVTSFPQVKKEDLFYLKTNVVEYVQDESKQAIMKQEDSRLLTLMQAAITNYASVAGNPYPVAQNINTAGVLDPDDLFDAAALIERRELPAATLLMSPTTYREIHKWSIEQTGWTFKDNVVAGEPVTSWGEWQIQRSVQVPDDKIFVVPEPEFLGVLPIMYSLDVEENPTPEKFHKGWVMDELIGMMILNPRGLATVTITVG